MYRNICHGQQSKIWYTKQNEPDSTDWEEWKRINQINPGVPESFSKFLLDKQK